MVERYERAAELLPPRLRRLAMELPDGKKERVEELRLRVGRPLTVVTGEGELLASPAAQEALVTEEDLERLVSGVTEYSRYASAESLRQGCLTLRGGFRLGVCGTVVMREGESWGIRDYSGLALRIVREKQGLGEELMPKLFEGERFCSALLLSPPGGGKTTLLRDLIRCLSQGGEDRPALRVAVVDERGEIAASWRGRPQAELGSHTDVLDGCPKALGIPMVLRSMSPQVIAVDEVASAGEVSAMEAAAHCGVGLLATVHAADTRELERKTLWRSLLAAEVFRKAVVIENDGGSRRYRVEELSWPGSSAAD